MRTLLPLLALSLTAACTAQAPTADNPLQLVVGPDGGSLTSDGLKMEVPAGAVDSSVTLTAFPTDRAINGVTTASQTWTFGPEGQVFNTPITVSIAFTGKHDAATLWWTKQGDVNTFTNLTTDAKDGWAAAAVAHFSEGAVGDDQCGSGTDASDTGDEADGDGENDTADEADTGEENDTGEEADSGDQNEGGDADSGEEGHQDEGDDGEEADGEHGDNGQDGDCEHDDHADDGDGGGDGHDDGDDTGESDD